MNGGTFTLEEHEIRFLFSLIHRQKVEDAVESLYLQLQKHLFQELTIAEIQELQGKLHEKQKN